MYRLIVILLAFLAPPAIADTNYTFTEPSCPVIICSCSIPEHCIDARRLPLFIARSVLRGLIAGLRADAKGVRTA